MFSEKTECSKIEKKTWVFFYMSVHVLLHLLNEMRKIDNMRCSAKDVIIYFNKWNIVHKL